MCAATGLASLPRFRLCAYLVSPAPQPTFIPWQWRWQPTLPSRGLCWRSIIVATAYDPKLARTLEGADLQHPLTLWNHFDALARVPLMVIRGANSDMLASTTLELMLSRRNELEIAVVPDQGHAPLLAEPKLMRRIAAFIASCDASARL